VALHHIKHPELTGFLTESSPRNVRRTELSRTQRVDLGGAGFEAVVRDLNVLLEKHLAEWLALPQSERVKAALQELKKL
jgi:hypothetical protein